MFHCYSSMTLIAFGFGIILLSIIVFISWLRMRHWPKVASCVVSSSMLNRRNPVGAGVVINEYRPSLEYEYIVKERHYIGKRIGFRDSRLWTDRLQEAEAGLFTLGTEVMVHVSPINPKKSIIKTKVKLRDLDFLGMLIAFGALVAGVGAWVGTLACP